MNAEERAASLADFINDVAAHIHQAVAQEREACARLADCCMVARPNGAVEHADYDEIAKAIRRRSN